MTRLVNTDLSRDSAFELLRIISQFFIILYHISYIWQNKAFSQTPFFQSIGIPLHIGVIIFVLLSGYFTIKPSSRGFIKLMGIFLVYESAEIIYNLYTANNTLFIIRQFFFLSNSHYWFVKTYLFLFLVSPLLNLWLSMASEKKRWYMAGVLFFVACYMGTTKGDESMVSGKNLVNFMMLYVLGNQLHYYSAKWRKIKTTYLISAYLILNIFLFVFSYYTYETFLYKCIKHLSFPYSSPIILLNSMLLFMIVGKQKIQSRFINYIAASSFAIYLIHACRPFLPSLHEYVTSWMQSITSSCPSLFFMYIGYAILVLFGCVVIDKLFSPIWKVINLLGNKIYNKLGF